MSDTELLRLVTRAIEQVAAAEWVSLPTLARQYDAAKNTVRGWISDMLAKGEQIRTCQAGREWRINRRDFERAFTKHYSKTFISSL